MRKIYICTLTLLLLIQTTANASGRVDWVGTDFDDLSSSNQETRDNSRGLDLGSNVDVSKNKRSFLDTQNKVKAKKNTREKSWKITDPSLFEDDSKENKAQKLQISKRVMASITKSKNSSTVSLSLADVELGKKILAYAFSVSTKEQGARIERAQADLDNFLVYDQALGREESIPFEQLSSSTFDDFFDQLHQEPEFGQWMKELDPDSAPKPCTSQKTIIQEISAETRCPADISIVIENHFAGEFLLQATHKGLTPRTDLVFGLYPRSMGSDELMLSPLIPR